MKSLNFEKTMNIFIKHLEAKKFSSKTVASYEWILRFFFVRLEKEQKIIDLREVTRNDILLFRKYLFEVRKKDGENSKYELSTQQVMISRIKILFRYLYRNEYILYNIFDNLDVSIRVRKKYRETLKKEVIFKILNSIPLNNILNIRDRALYELLYGTGLRVGEAGRLNVTDIDLQNRVLLVGEGKGKKERLVPYGKYLSKILKLYIKKSRPYFLKKVKEEVYRERMFISSQGKGLNSVFIWKHLKEVCRKFKIDEKVSPHIIRHSYATHILENGARLKDVKDLLGHSSIQTTVVYTHFSIKSLRWVLKKYHPRENELYEEIEIKEVIKELK